MNRKILLLFVVFSLWCSWGVASAQILFRFTLSPQIYISIPRSPDIMISVDRGEGATYNIGDPIGIRYRTTRDGYVNIIDYLPNGDVRVLVRNRFIRSGLTETYSGTVSGPGGTERLVALLTADRVPDADLERFIQAPHQAGRIFRGRYATGRTHFEVIARIEGTVLIIEPSTVKLGPRSSLVFTATLTTSLGRPLEGQELVWSVTDGSLATSRTVTGPDGTSRNTFTAPSFSGTVTVNVRFEGDVRLAPSSTSATVEVGRRIVGTVLSLEPQSITLSPGERVRIIARLQDEEGNPLSGRTVEWEVPQGTLSASSSITDTSGRASVFYTAPNVRTTTQFDLVARFPGSAQFAPSETSMSIVVERARPVLSQALFFVDFSGETPRHNGDRLRYQGKIVSGDFAVNNVSLLEMRRRETLEFRFTPGGRPEEGAMYFWVQGDRRGSLRVTLNGKDFGTVKAQEGILSPSMEQKITVFAEDLVEGTNILEVTAEGDGASRVRLQRIVIVF